MIFPENPQMEVTHHLESEKKKWVIAGIQIRGPLKPVLTKPAEKQRREGEEGDFPTTPTAAEARIPAKLRFPEAPRKRKSVSRCNNGYISREFFTPPDLETVFIRRVERA